MNPEAEIKREEVDQVEERGAGQLELATAESVDQTGFQFEVSGDQRSVRIHNPNIPGMDINIDAQTLDVLIWRLRQCRNQMQHSHQTAWSGGNCQVTISSWHAEPSLAGGTLLHLHDPGLGWLHCEMPPEQSLQLAEVLHFNANLEIGSKH